MVEMDMSELKLGVFRETAGSQGSGSLMGLKACLHAVEKPLLVCSSGSASLFSKCGIEVPIIHTGLNAIDTARGAARSSGERTVLVYAGDGATNMSLSSIVDAEENMIYVCYNNQSYATINEMLPLGKGFAKHVAPHASYTATASVGYFEDLVSKLRKCAEIEGLKFIDLLCPEPSVWKYDPADTVRVCRAATESAIWPLYEVKNGDVNVTKQPTRIRPVDVFLSMQKRFKLSDEDQGKFQKRVNRSWKSLLSGKLL